MRAQHHIEDNEQEFYSKVREMEPREANKGHGKHYT